MTKDFSGEFNPVLLEKERIDDLLEKLPEVAGLRRLPVHYTCFDVKEPWIALGSNIGLVCVYNSQKNRLFQLHEIKQTITVVKLNFELDCLAYGSQDGVLRTIFFTQLTTESSEALVREAQKRSVTALEWNKHRLFSGFSSGKVLMTTMKLNQGSCTTGLLLQTGSHVVQLTSHGHHLLISTLASSFTLQFITGKLSQIGHQDRKAGPYGACFSSEPDNMFVARPGLRLWKAQTSTGTVISTSKYREALSLQTIPIIPILGVNPSHPVITDRTQFTLLYLWHRKFVITHHQHALWVLDPSCSSVIATLAEHLPIIDITCYKDSVYILRPHKRPLIKLSIHSDFKRHLNPDHCQEASGSSSDLSSAIDSGSYRLSVEAHANNQSSEANVGSSPVVTPKEVLPSHGMSQSMSQDVSPSMLKVGSQNVSQNVAHDVAAVVSHDTSPNAPKEMSENVPENLQDGSSGVKDKTPTVTPLSLAELPIEDRLQKMHTFLEAESSTIAVQSVLKKKKKKKKKAVSPNVIDSPVLTRRSQESVIDQVDTLSCSPDTHHHTHPELSTGHSHSPTNTMVDVDGSHAHFKTDDKSDDVPVHVDQDVVTTSDHDSMHGHDTSDGMAISSLAAVNQLNENDSQATVEAVGYSIEKLHEDQRYYTTNDGSAVQMPVAIEHTQTAVVGSPKDNVVHSVEMTAAPINNPIDVVVVAREDDTAGDATSKKMDNFGEEDSAVQTFLPEDLMPDRQQSMTNEDFSALFKKCIDDAAIKRGHHKELFNVISPPQPKEVVRDQETKREQLITNYTADIWEIIPPCPSKLSVARIAATGKVLWAMDSKGATFWYSSCNDQWHAEKQNMEHISSSCSGAVTWGLYKGQSYVRKGASKKLPQGQSWQKVDSEMLKLIAVGEACVWAVNMDEKLMCRQGVSSLSPEGFQWEHTQISASFAKSISFCDDVLWACDRAGTAYALAMTASLSHAQWETINRCLLDSISLNSGGIIWGVEQQLGTVLFCCDVAVNRPRGTGPWWEVNISQPVIPEMSFAGAIANKVSAVVPDAITNRLDSISNRLSQSLPANIIKNTISSFTDHNYVVKKVTTSTEGVWVLDGKGVIRHCRGVVTGCRFVSVSLAELMKMSLWIQVSAPSTVPLDQGGLVWALRSTKELFCFDKDGAVQQVEYPSSSIVHVASSSTTVWIVTKNGIYAREGVSQHNPKGVVWTVIDMGPIQNHAAVLWVSCGKQVVWLVDSMGSVLLRFGVLNKVEGSSLPPPWIEVDSPFTLAQVVVGSEDWIVWACDTHHNIYARQKVTDTFPIGRNWELVPGCKAINLCCSGSYVWALCPGGEILCRFGIRRDNIMGDYWKCISGCFCQISATMCGQLWGINAKGRLLKRETHLLSVSKSLASTKMDNTDDWIVL